jgi:hypothetical protein
LEISKYAGIMLRQNKSILKDSKYIYGSKVFYIILFPVTHQTMSKYMQYCVSYDMMKMEHAVEYEISQTQNYLNRTYGVVNIL